ncbi:SDR family oxidoreductase [Corticibacterium sp. UT-5YL-CI-8]|nr:SDR family oxidoreductase [Tianweitania sp. UT-5YL-CI-8]
MTETTRALAGKAIVITGSGGGLGAAYARHAAALGAAVLINDIDPEAAERTALSIVNTGGKAAACAGDISSWRFAETLMDACQDFFGALHGLVNNAGILRPAKIEDVAELDLRRMFEVNVLGTAACTQAAVRRLRAQGHGGSIVNVASGSHAGDIALGLYGATKGAVASLTYGWAMELRGSDIRLNAVSPLAETAMAAQNASLLELQSASREVKYHTLPAAEINAPVVSFLLSDLSRAIHGQIVRIAGRQLSYLTHPTIAQPVMEGEWNFENVVDAFAGTLSKAQRKLGLSVEELDGFGRP